MLTEREQIIIRLQKLDSPRRVKWLRYKISAYYDDLAARDFFRIPYYICGCTIEPESEAIDLALRLGAIYKLTTTERHAAYVEQWRSALKTAETLGNHLKLIYKNHYSQGGSTDTLPQFFWEESQKFPLSWPYLSPKEFKKIGKGFRKVGQGFKIIPPNKVAKP